MPIHARLCAFCLFLMLSVGSANADEASKFPNILMIIADDMGLDASPCHTDWGNEKPDMPVLKQLCQDGLVFDNVWAYPTCSPTRASILTGKYGFRTGIGSAVSPRRDVPGIKLSEKTIHQAISKGSPGKYAQAVIGKWHLSDNNNGGNLNPHKMGVDHYAGLIRGGHKDYFNWQRTENGKTRNETKYATTVFTDEAIEWIGQRNSPWFLWLAYTAPHFPLHLPPEHLHNRQGLSGERRDMRRNALSYYFAALEAMDREMGRLLASMSEHVRANTLIIFLGDNGSPGRVAQAPFERRKAKGTLFEGGIRVPMVVQGAGVGRKGVREKALVNTTDIFATLGEITGTSLAKAADSISFRSLFTKADVSKRHYLYSEQFNTNRPNQTNGWAIRDKTHKLLVLEDGREQLFRLRGNHAEEQDLLQSNDRDSQIIANTLRGKAKELRSN